MFSDGKFTSVDCVLFWTSLKATIKQEATRRCVYYSECPFRLIIQQKVGRNVERTWRELISHKTWPGGRLSC